MAKNDSIDLDFALKRIHELALADGDIGYAYWYQVGQLLRRAAEMQTEIDALCKELEFRRAMAEPDVFLSRWKIIKTDDRLTHLVGYNSLNIGCVASPLASFDRKAMRAKTRAGLVYQLVGRPGLFLEIANILDDWCHDSIGTCTDVTKELVGSDEA